MKIQKWIKGEPVTQFENGHVYVIEFGFISCGPCRESISHLTKIAKQYSKELSVVSVFVFENGLAPKDTLSREYMARVEHFVKDMGNEMEYSVAIDDPVQTMATLWLRASGHHLGAPKVFVIDKKGKIAWIGHPMYLNRIVEEIINDKFDYNAAINEQLEKEKVLKEAIKAQKKGDYITAINRIDSLIKVRPDEPNLYHIKFSCLLDYDLMAASSFAKRILHRECKNSEYILFRIFMEMLSSPKPDLDLGIKISKRVIKLTKFELISAYSLEKVAWAYAKKGNLKKAIKMQERALSMLDAYIQAYKVDNLGTTRSNFVANFKKYKAAS